MDGTNIREIDISALQRSDVSVIAGDNSESVYEFAKSGGCLSGADVFTGRLLSKDSFIVMDITNDNDTTVAVTWGFSEQDNGGYIGFKMGILPHLRTRIALPLSILDGNTLFLPRTPGKLKTVTQGRPIRLSKLAGFEVRLYNNANDVRLRLHRIYISDTEPDYPLIPTPMVDKLGQKNCADWKGKTHSEQELTEFLNNEYKMECTPSKDFSSYGGWLKKRFEATGYFALHHDGRRWWLVDPLGYAFFSIGLDCVGIGGECNIEGIECLTSGLPDRENVGWEGLDSEYPGFFSWHKENLYKAFGEQWYEKWVEMTKKRLINWRFNTVACWSDPEYIKRADQPYIYILKDYPETAECIFRDFPDVFSPEFERNAAKWAQQLDEQKENPYLIGYFMSNEPKWAFVDNLNIAQMLLESDKPFASKNKLIDYLKQEYIQIEQLNSAWKTDFSGFDSLLEPYKGSYTQQATDDLWDFSSEMIREYIKAPALAAKQVDKNHLNLGIRYAWISSKAIVSGSEYCDAFSFNCYTMDPTEAIEETLKFIDKPVIIGEFHFGALDRGLDATGIRAVTTQQQRGMAYRRYMHAAAAHPNCIGAHYFILNDQPYLGRFDGENYQIGLVDVCNKPYYEFVKYVTLSNSELYEVSNGDAEPIRENAEKIPPIFF